ncbi:MAG: amidohydrolase [Acidobacteriota bacterium]
MKRILVPALLALATGTPIPAAVTSQELDSRIAALEPQIVEWRRWFHEHPELSNREFETSARIAAILREMGLEPRTGIAHTGVVAIVEGGKPGPRVALRADIDALPVTEETGLPFASTATAEFNGQPVGVMHACGHDVHMAMLLGAAKVLAGVREELPGSVMLIFQPAEEGAPGDERGGAQLMLEEGLFDDWHPDAVFGIHVGLGQPGGRLAVRSGPAMASEDSFRIWVHGRQTHGARPWNGVDPVVIGSQIVLGLQTIASRQVNVTQAPSIITIGKFAAGVRNNIIPDRAELWGTVRSFDPEMRRDILERVERTARDIAGSAGATVTFELDPGYPVTVNDPELTARMMPTLERISGDRPPVEASLQTGAEDFSYFANASRGLYLFLGAVAPDEDPITAPSNHSPLFDFYEPNMELGVRALVHLTVDYLEEDD